MALSLVFNPFTSNFDTISTVTLGTANGLTITSDQILSLTAAASGVTGALTGSDWDNFESAFTATQAATASQVINTIVKRDGNSNFQTNMVAEAAATHATTGGTTTLTVASGPYQTFTGVANQTLSLPNATTISNGFHYWVMNQSTGSITVNDFTGSTIGTVGPTSSTLVVLIANGTTAGTWTFNAIIGNGITALTGDVTATGPGSAVATIATNAVTNTKLAQMGAHTVKGNNSGVTANPSDLALSNVTETGSAVLTISNGTNTIVGAANLTIQVSQSTTSTSGYLSSTDWNTFNNKQNALTLGNLTDAGTDGIVITGGTGAVVGTGTSIAQHVADSTHNGYLSSADWSTFNGKQAAGNYITALTGDVTASGPGSAAATIANNVVTNAKLAQMAAHTFKGNNTGSTANALDLTATQLTAELNLFTSTLQGLVPASGGGTNNFLRADGTFAAPGSTAVLTSISAGVYLNSNFAVSANTVLKFDTTIYDTNAAYSASTGLFTAPVSGQYEITGSIEITSGSVGVYAVVNGTAKIYLGTVTTTSTAISGTLSVNSTDTIGIYLDAAKTATGGTSNSAFVTTAAFNLVGGGSAFIGAAYYLGTNASPGADTVLKFDNSIYDTNSAYSTSTGLFTAPFSGYYRFSATGQTTATGQTGIYLKVNGTATIYIGAFPLNADGSGSQTIKLTAADTVGFYVDSSRTINGGTSSGAHLTVMSIEMVK